MVVGRRLFAAASAAAVVAALSTGVSGATAATATASGSSGSGVTFTSQPGVAAIVAHYTVGHSDKHAQISASISRPSIDNRSLPRLSKPLRGSKALQIASSRLTAGVAGNSSAGKSDGSGTPPTSSSFIGQQGSKTTCSYFAHGCNPPDEAFAASPRFEVQGVNTQWEVLDSAGNVQTGWPVSAATFFGVPNVTNADGTPCDLGSGSQPFMSDPRVLYDPIDHRFWAAMLQVENGLGIAPDCPKKSVYYVAVTQTSDPRDAWNVYEFDMTMGQPFSADFTQLGFNGKAVYFSANMFGDVSGFYAELFEANKAQMEEGLANFTADGFFNLQATGPGTTAATGPFLADTVQPAINLDNSAGNHEVFVDTLDGPDPVTGNFCGFFGGGAADACKGLALWTMTNPVGHDYGGGAPTLKGTYVPTIGSYTFPPPADEPTCTQCVDASDLRISGTPVVRDGSVYAAWETGTDNGTQTVPGIEWAQIKLHNPGSKKSSRSGYYNSSGDTAVTYPALVPQENGDLVMVFSRMSNTVNPEVRYIVRGGEGNSQFTGDGVLLKAGESSYRPTLCGTAIPVCRWGDYSAASFDGSHHIWFAGEYANLIGDPTQPPVFGRNWGTWIGAINVGD